MMQFAKLKMSCLAYVSIVIMCCTNCLHRRLGQWLGWRNRGRSKDRTLPVVYSLSFSAAPSRLVRDSATKRTIRKAITQSVCKSVQYWYIQASESACLLDHRVLLFADEISISIPHSYGASLFVDYLLTGYITWNLLTARQVGPFIGRLLRVFKTSLDTHSQKRYV